MWKRESLMHSTFVIGCKFLAARPVVYECVRSIKKVYGDSAEIIVIDSDSEDKSYFSVLRDLGVVVDDAVNHHYTSGAIWCAFEKYIRDSYCFLHDSMTVGGKIDDYVKNDITSLRYFNSGKFLREYGGGLYPGEFGFDSVEQFEWVNEQFLLHTSYSIYSIPERFTGLYGSTSVCKRETLEKLYKEGFSKVLPTNKIQDQGMERAWGIALALEGYDIKTHTIGGDCNRNPDTSIIKKVHFSGTVLNRE